MSDGLSVRAALPRGPLRVEVELQVSAGETVAVLGPNGAGKTTLLRVLAGLLPIESGRIALDGVVLDEGSGGAWVPPELRAVGVVFQDYLLFPHLSALENVAFGPRSRGHSRKAARATAARWLERVGLGDRGAALPRELSGGEAQRVALARALAVEPRLLLLDEPLAALDAGARLTTRRDLVRYLRDYGGCRVLVTHDPVEALAMADRLVVLEAGRVVQVGTPAEITARPRSRYVADLVGLNLFNGRAAGDRVAIGDFELSVAGEHQGDVLLTVHPRAVSLHRVRPEGSARNVWAGRATVIDGFDGRARVQVDGPLSIVAEITAAAATDLGLGEGGEIWASVKATEVTIYPA